MFIVYTKHGVGALVTLAFFFDTLADIFYGSKKRAQRRLNTAGPEIRRFDEILNLESGITPFRNDLNLDCWAARDCLDTMSTLHNTSGNELGNGTSWAFIQSRVTLGS